MLPGAPVECRLQRQIVTFIVGQSGYKPDV